MIKRSLIILVLFLCLGCVHVILLEESGIKYPPSSKVDILLEPPSRPFKQIAILESKAENSTMAIARIREKAKELGADAIMPLNKETNTGVGTGLGGKWSFFALNGNGWKRDYGLVTGVGGKWSFLGVPITETNVSMVAIKYLD
jgi:hypothetical protein